MALKKLARDYLTTVEVQEASGERVHPEKIAYNLALGLDHLGREIQAPLTIRLEALKAILAVRLARLSRAEQSIDVSDNRQQPSLNRMDVLQAILAAPPDIRAAILAGRAPAARLLEGGTDEPTVDETT